MHRISRQRVSGTIWAPASVLALACIGALPMALGAQTVTGTLVASAAGAPVAGALVHLLDESGTVVARALSDGAGRFALAAPEAGTYRVRAERIGHASTVSDPLRLADGEFRELRLVAAVQAIHLDGIEVDGDARCEVRPQEGLALAQVWEEARKALSAASWTDHEGVYRYEVVSYTRQLDADARTVVAEDARYATDFRQRTFSSLPAERLIEDGFVQTDPEGTSYFGPDADVLLSDAFLDTHCFRLSEGKDESAGLIGLRFQPVEGRTAPEISGTMWIERESARLQWLEFRYEQPHPQLSRDDRLGGRIEFQALPSGPWIVSRWRIRMPRLERQMGGGSRSGRVVLIGIHEEGAEVARILDLQGKLISETQSGTVAGVVLSSAGGTPLAGAQVWLEGTGRSTTSEDDGSYRLPGLLDGEYDVLYSHASLDSIGYRPDPISVAVRRGAIERVELLAPAAWDVALGHCGGDEDVPPGTAVLLGTIRDQAGQARADAVVTLLWSSFDFSQLESSGRRPSAGTRQGGGNAPAAVVEESRGGLRITPDEGGFYVVCGVPTDTRMDLSVTLGNEPGPDEAFSIARSQRIFVRDLVVPPAD